MILTIGIIIVLIISFSIGHHRGLVRMILGLVGYLVALVVAKTGASFLGIQLASLFPILKTSTQNAGSALNDSNGNQFFYNGVAFIIIFIVVLFICRWLTRRFSLVTKLPVIHQLNAILGGLINFVIVYMSIFFLLTIFQVWPSEWWQNQINTSGLASWIINNTPVLSQQVVYWLAGR
ncbi:CvpA family protein [Paucilactobacillus kaifaensis]|uniref:CvpA family protein n=1 Tax=Paucilactobacillus kaifaensis TaxID=2559921 RepID=UPI0010F91D56|nr:CvpA family protein [Paucilactobacillus kaifaensis]